MACLVCCCFANTPPESSTVSGFKGTHQNRLLAMQNQPNAFQVDLAGAPCASPMKCIAGCLCPCCSACYWRKAALEQFGQGMQDYECCQGKALYIMRKTSDIMRNYLLYIRLRSLPMLSLFGIQGHHARAVHRGVLLRPIVAVHYENVHHGCQGTPSRSS